jgi:LysM repeat protein
MCHKPVDGLPLDSSIFSGSWRGIGLGVLIIIGIVVIVTYSQAPSNEVAAALATVENTPTHTPTVTITPTPTQTPSPVATSTSTATATPALRSHVVESGDSLLWIASIYNVTVEEITQLNGIDETTTLNVGQTLRIPPAPPGEAAAESAQTEAEPPPLLVYVVKSGDTLSDIAFNYGTTVDGIVAMNPDQNLDWIFPGQEIIVPLATPTPTFTPTPPPTPTATPQPAYTTPDLLGPANGQVVDAPVLLLSWTATTLLAEDEFYVVQLTWLNGATTKHWLKSSSLRIAKEERPANGLTTWQVTIMRQTGLSTQGTPTGIALSQPSETRLFEWR